MKSLQFSKSIKLSSMKSMKFCISMLLSVYYVMPQIDYNPGKCRPKLNIAVQTESRERYPRAGKVWYRGVCLHSNQRQLSGQLSLID